MFAGILLFVGKSGGELVEERVIRILISEAVRN